MGVEVFADLRGWLTSQHPRLKSLCSVTILSLCAEERACILYFKWIFLFWFVAQDSDLHSRVLNPGKQTGKKRPRLAFWPLIFPRDSCTVFQDGQGDEEISSQTSLFPTDVLLSVKPCVLETFWAEGVLSCFSWSLSSAQGFPPLTDRWAPRTGAFLTGRVGAAPRGPRLLQITSRKPGLSSGSLDPASSYFSFRNNVLLSLCRFPCARMSLFMLISVRVHLYPGNRYIPVKPSCTKSPKYSSSWRSNLTEHWNLFSNS